MLIVGCASGGSKLEATDADTAAPSEAVKVSYALPSLARDPLAATAEAINSEGAGMSLELIEQGATCNDSPTLLQADLAAGDAADIALQCFNGLRQFIDAGVAQPIDDLIADDPEFDLDQYTASSLEPFQQDGKLYGLPNATSANLLYYNTDLFQAAGLNPDDPPDTWTEFIAAAAALDDPEANIEGTIFAPDTFNFETLLRSNGGSWMNPNETDPAFNGPAGVEALDLLRQMNEEGTLVVSEDNETTVDTFARGQAAMMIYSSARIGQLEQQDSLDFRVGPVPAPADGRLRTSLQGMGFLMFAQDDAQRSAWEAMKALTSPPAVATFSESTGFLSPSIPAVEDPALLGDFLANSPPRRTANSLLDTGVRVYEWPGSRATEIQAVVVDQIILGVRGEKTAQQALDDAAEQVRGLLPPR